MSELTQEEFEEFKKYITDKEWRMSHLHHILDQDGNTVVYKRNSIQNLMEFNPWYWELYVKSRQVGSTTAHIINASDDLHFIPNYRIGFIAFRREDATRIVDRIKFDHEHMPREIREQIKIVKDNKNELGFSNGATIFATNSTMSGTVQKLIITEFGPICQYYPQRAEEIVQGSFSSVNIGNKLIIESTVRKNYGPFAEFIKQCIERNKKKIIPTKKQFLLKFYPWYLDEKCNLDAEGVPVYPRHEEYFKEIEFKTKHILTPEQKAFWISTESTLGTKIKTEFPSCVTEDTLISTSYGIIAMRDVQPDGEYILKKYDKGIQPVYELKTHLGYTIKCTRDHRIKTQTGEFKKLHELKIGDYVSLSTQHEFGNKIEFSYNPNGLYKVSVNMDEDIGRFLGYFMGDGSYHDYQISICCTSTDTDVIEDVSWLLRKYFGNAIARNVGTNGGGVELRVGCKPAAQVFEAMGIIISREYGGVIRKICVPDCIKTAPRNVVKQFLRGYFESDGCAYAHQRGMSVYSKSEKFLKDIQILLLLFGITSRMHIAKKINSNGREYTGRVLVLRGAECEIFNTEIGFISDRKKNIILDAIPKPRNRGVRKPSKIIYSDKIESIELCGEEHVYDITTSTHEFSANGIIVHNCIDEALEKTTEGAYYAHEFEDLRKQGRICKVPHEVGIPVNTMWDLSYHHTVCWFFQVVGRAIHVIDYYAANQEKLIPHFTDMIAAKERTLGYRYGIHIFPFDSEKHEDIAQDETRVAGMRRMLGIKSCKVCPKFSVEEGINLTRKFLSYCWFDEENTKVGVDALENYSMTYNNKLGQYIDIPLKDGVNDDPADAFRIGAVFETHLMNRGGHYQNTSGTGTDGGGSIQVVQLVPEDVKRIWNAFT